MFVVTKAIVHAVTSPNPKTRYLVGNDAKFFAFMKWSYSDHLWDVMVGISPALSKILYKMKSKKNK